MLCFNILFSADAFQVLVDRFGAKVSKLSVYRTPVSTVPVQLFMRSYILWGFGMNSRGQIVMRMLRLCGKILLTVSMTL